jgi:hypothetical protein
VYEVALVRPRGPPRQTKGAGSPCPRCGCRDFVDVPIHGGRSVRRDCAKCRLFLGFPIWYSRQRTKTK